MKNSILLFIAILAVSTIANGQVDPNAIKKDIKNINKEESVLKKEKKEERKELRKLNGMEVSYQAKQQFLIDFDKATDIKWERTPYYDEATFTNDGKTLKAYYDEQAKLVGTSAIVTFADLPEKAQKYINEKYKSYNKGAVIFFDDNEYNETDMLLYSLQFDDEDSYFVELTKGTNKIVVHVSKAGEVFFFKELQK
jgi:hypothetical protein